jgi:hypothetical protein
LVPRNTGRRPPGHATRTAQPPTERNESHPFIAAFLLLGLAGIVLEGFNSPDWYWVLTSAVVSLVAMLVLGAVVVYFILLVVEHFRRCR